MSGVTTNYGLILPDPGEAYDVAITNSNNVEIDEQLKKIEQVFAAVDVSDTNWSYYGGMHLLVDAQLRKRVHLNLKMVRIAGGTVALTTTYIQAASLVTAPNLPNGYSITRNSTLQESTGADAWGMKIKIDPTGKLFLATDTGTASITVGRQFEIDMTWLV